MCPDTEQASGPANAIFCRAGLSYGGASFATPVVVDVEIRDARQSAPGRWQDCGFELMAHPSRVVNWEDEDIEAIHYAEIELLARQLTGCDHALVSSHIQRNPAQASRHSDLAPIQAVHSDFAASYGDLLRSRYQRGDPAMQACLQRAGLDQDAVANAQRLVILQFWRNLGAAKMDLPLAFCDARTVPQADIRPSLVEDYAGGGINFETLGILPPTTPGQHHWYVYPNMQRDEVVAFRTYDSARLGTAQPYWTPHTAFADPAVLPGHPSRASIELRATCVFL